MPVHGHVVVGERHQRPAGMGQPGVAGRRQPRPRLREVAHPRVGAVPPGDGLAGEAGAGTVVHDDQLEARIGLDEQVLQRPQQLEGPVAGGHHHARQRDGTRGEGSLGDAGRRLPWRQPGGRELPRWRLAVGGEMPGDLGVEPVPDGPGQVPGGQPGRQLEGQQPERFPVQPDEDERLAVGQTIRRGGGEQVRDRSRQLQLDHPDRRSQSLQRRGPLGRRDRPWRQRPGCVERSCLAHGCLASCRSRRRTRR